MPVETWEFSIQVQVSHAILLGERGMKTHGISPAPSSKFAFHQEVHASLVAGRWYIIEWSQANGDKDISKQSGLKMSHLIES